MDGFFITEKETEELLQLETRNILKPDGSRESANAFKLERQSLDYILDAPTITEEWIAEISLTHSIESNKPFNKAYFEMLNYVHRMLEKSRGGYNYDK